MLSQLAPISPSSKLHFALEFKKYIKSIGFKVENGRIYNETGKLVGTYTRISFDDWTDGQNAIMFGVAARAQAMKEAIAAFGIGTAVGGATGGLAVYYGVTGGAIIQLGIRYGTEAWRVIAASRPLEKMGHAAKHYQKFLQYANLTKQEVAKILEYVKQTGSQIRSGPQGEKVFQKIVEIGSHKVTVEVVVSSSGVIKSGYPVP